MKAHQGVTRSTLPTQFWASVAGLVLLAGGLGVNASLLLSACAVILPFGVGSVGSCDVPREVSENARMESEGRDLERLINDLEGDLAQKICPKKPRPSKADTTVQTPALTNPPKIDEDLWKNRDLAAIEGCWGLNSTYVIIDQRTGKASPQSTWNICFDGNGKGRQTMRSEDGVQCEGEVNGKFGPAGSLVIEEDEDLVCSGGIVVFKRKTTCALDGTGGAACQSVQPRTGGRGAVRLQRKE